MSTKHCIIWESLKAMWSLYSDKKNFVICLVFPGTENRCFGEQIVWNESRTYHWIRNDDQVYITASSDRTLTCKLYISFPKILYMESFHLYAFPVNLVLFITIYIYNINVLYYSSHEDHTIELSLTCIQTVSKQTHHE
jgi:hypothetical protein